MKHHVFSSLSAALLLAVGSTVSAGESLKGRILDLAHDAKETALDVGHAAKETALDAGHTVTHGAREGWRKSKPYLSEEPEVYQQGVRQRLDDIRLDLVDLRRDAVDLSSRAYFLTRLTALEQQYQDALDQLAAITPDAMRRREEGLRSRLDNSIGRLEEYITLAQEEVRDLNRAR